MCINFGICRETFSQDVDILWMEGKIVLSVVVWFKNASPPRDHFVTFSFGGSLLNPKVSRSVSAEALLREPKWTRFPGDYTYKVRLK